MAVSGEDETFVSCVIHKSSTLLAFFEQGGPSLVRFGCRTERAVPVPVPTVLLRKQLFGFWKSSCDGSRSVFGSWRSSSDSSLSAFGSWTKSSDGSSLRSDAVPGPRPMLFVIDLLMGPFRAAVFHHCGVSKICPLALMGRFPP